MKRIQDGRSVIVLERSLAQCVPCRGYVENVAHAIALAAASEAAAGRVYNVAEPDPYTEAAWAAEIGAAMGWLGRVIAVPRDYAPKHLNLPYNYEQHLFMDSARIRAELGYAECVPVDVALRRTIEWEQASPPERINAAEYDYAAEDEAAARAMA